jgi:hypothetical protein
MCRFQLDVGSGTSVVTGLLCSKDTLLIILTYFEQKIRVCCHMFFIVSKEHTYMWKILFNQIYSFFFQNNYGWNYYK